MSTKSNSGLDAPLVQVERDEWMGDRHFVGPDDVVREEPLELRVGGIAIAVVMRTPGHDLELARGFALTERIVAEPRDIVAVRHCDHVEDPEAEDNVVQIVLDAHVEVDWVRLRRNFYASTSCGICGKASIAAAMGTAPPIEAPMDVSIDVLRCLPDRLRDGQAVFARTGGLHGAALFSAQGESLVVREDVGRHNAVDKVVGWASTRLPWPLATSILAVSGRVSFEIVQKAVAARIPVIAAVSAPSSLAIELAQRSGVTLVGFVRGDRACVYAGFDRVKARECGRAT